MQHTRFGKTNLQVSRLALGCVSFGVRHAAAEWDPYTRDGRRRVERTVHAALEAGINLFDVAPDYGDGYAETVLGAALGERRSEAILATKVHYGGATPAQVARSVHESLRRLATDHLDIVQLHGGNYPPSSVRRIVNEGLLDTLCALREEGRVRHIGLTVNDPVTARRLIETGHFATIQLMYNFIEQAAARHALDWATDQDMGVTVMRPLTAGTLERQLALIAPEWLAARSPHEVCLRFLLADRRVHTINVGMRGAREVHANVALVAAAPADVDITAIPRSVGKLARLDDRVSDG